MSKPRALVSWSSGKDSAFVVHELRKQGDIQIVGLLSTVTDMHERVAMHGVRVALLERQAEELGLPLYQVMIPNPCPNQIYERRMAEAIESAQRARVTHIVFGDLFLEDVRRYRETMLAQTGIQPLFPLWRRSTRELADVMIASGLKAVVTCVDPQQLSSSFAGKDYDATFLANLPEGVDPCGERGEFHTFVWDGPMFGNSIQIDIGETVERGGFIFTDVLSKFRA